MKPSGSAARKKSRSSGIIVGPAQPKMTAALIPAAAGSKPHQQALLLLQLQLGTDLLRRRSVDQRAGLNAVVDALGAEVGSLHGQLQSAEGVGKLLLQPAPFRLGEVDRFHRAEL